MNTSPPPPPPPPPTQSPKPSSGGPAAVFAELNRGEAITKGLRKVDKSEMTHKNPALRAATTVPGAASTPCEWCREKDLTIGQVDCTFSQQRSPLSQPNHKLYRERNRPNLSWKETSGSLCVSHRLSRSHTDFLLKEHQENESELIVENVELSQIVNLYGCKNTTVLIKGKVNAVTLSTSIANSEIHGSPY